jgi:phospholipid/cholesterol/gamma-HCH transport system substrate-binding protein
LRRLGDDVEQGKGTVGALLKDPSVYEDLKTILGNIERNRLLKSLIRYTIKKEGLNAP